MYGIIIHVLLIILYLLHVIQCSYMYVCMQLHVHTYSVSYQLISRKKQPDFLAVKIPYRTLDTTSRICT